ncbi:hypothetical protein JTB14_011261 [Gonioctena quinquepunctata]|nr:hypothetical protein JTB14_011261 [Gonioctena quinquepunctata]
MESDQLDLDSENFNNQIGPFGTEYSSNDDNPELLVTNRNNNKRKRDEMENTPLTNNNNNDEDISWDEPSTSQTNNAPNINLPEHAPDLRDQPFMFIVIPRN